jgi:ribosomal protein S18 acetylase RimI-like enzyme
MLFLLNDIINEIIDNEDIDTLLEKVEDTFQHVAMMFYNYSKLKISPSYTKNLLLNLDNKVVLYCIDDVFEIENCPCSLIYNKHIKCETEVVYYILILITKSRFRGLGYASLLLDSFIELVKNENEDNEQNVKIVVSSLETAVTFYEGYGFKWTRESLSEHPLLTYFEKYQEDKEYFILEHQVK